MAGTATASNVRGMRHPVALMMEQQKKDQDHRDRHTDRPQYAAFSEVHFRSPF
jgi:hypothetical protein